MMEELIKAIDSIAYAILSGSLLVFSGLLINALCGRK